MKAVLELTEQRMLVEKRRGREADGARDDGEEEEEEEAHEDVGSHKMDDMDMDTDIHVGMHEARVN